MYHHARTLTSTHRDLGLLLLAFLSIGLAQVAGCASGRTATATELTPDLSDSLREALSRADCEDQNALGADEEEAARQRVGQLRDQIDVDADAAGHELTGDAADTEDERILLGHSGELDRKVLPPDERELIDLKRVGKLISVQQSGDRTAIQGTATLVGKRLIITAAHCIPWRRDGSIGISIFVPGYNQGRDGRGDSECARVVRWHYPSDAKTGLLRRGRVEDIPAHADIAIGVLDSELGSRWGYLGVVPFDPRWTGIDEFVVAGYSDDRYHGERMTADRAVRVCERRGSVLLHDGDTESGASGGPIFTELMVSGQRHTCVVGVHTGWSGMEYNQGTSWSRLNTNTGVDVARIHKRLGRLRNSE